MNVRVANKIYIKNPTQAIRDYCWQNLVLDNPEYHKKERMGLWVGNTPREIVLFERDGDDLILPFGCFKDIYQLEPQATYTPEFAPKRTIHYQSGINLYPYQKEAVFAALNARNGIVVMPCGAGKTQTALEIIARLGGRALWLTHTQDLLNQSMNRAKSVYGGTFTYGTITEGKINIGSGITFATVQTMSKIDLSDYKFEWDVIVVDECHKAVGSPTKCMQFYKVLSQLSARYKYGITATPKRSDGLERTMFALIGEKIIEIDREAVADTTCPIEIKTIPTGWMPNLDIALAGDGTLNYSALIDDMIENDERMELVCGYIGGCEGATLVLGNRVKYLQKMAGIVSAGTENLYGEPNNDGKRVLCLSGMGQSKKAKDARKEALRKLNDGELDVIFATYQLAKEGLDCPNLRNLILATPEKDETTVVQAVGRVGRKADGKACGTVLDFVDDFAMFKGWYKKRKKCYEKIDAEIISDWC